MVDAMIALGDGLSIIAELKTGSLIRHQSGTRYLQARRSGKRGYRKVLAPIISWGRRDKGSVGCVGRTRGARRTQNGYRRQFFGRMRRSENAVEIMKWASETESRVCRRQARNARPCWAPCVGGLGAPQSPVSGGGMTTGTEKGRAGSMIRNCKAHCTGVAQMDN